MSDDDAKVRPKPSTMEQIERLWIRAPPAPPWADKYKSMSAKLVQGLFALGALVGVLAFLLAGFNPGAMFIVGVGLAGLILTRFISRRL